MLQWATPIIQVAKPIMVGNKFLSLDLKFSDIIVSIELLALTA